MQCPPQPHVMNRDGVLKFLRALSASNVTAHGQWVSASCPLAPWQHQSGKDAHPSFAVICNDTAESYTNCFTCGGSDLTTIVFKLRHYGAKLPKYDLKTAMEVAVADGEHPVAFNVKEWGQSQLAQDEYVTFPELWLATFVSALKSSRAMKYLLSRGLDHDTVEALDLRFDTEKNAICFPIRDFEGALCGLRGRRLAPTEDQPRYHVYKSGLGSHNRVVWYGESWLDFDQPVVMCESVFDVASVFRVYRNVCAPMSATFSEERAKRMKRATQIVTLFDADKAGDSARQRAHRYLPLTNIVDLVPPEGLKDPGEMSMGQLRKLLKGMVKLQTGAAA